MMMSDLFSFFLWYTTDKIVDKVNFFLLPYFIIHRIHILIDMINRFYTLVDDCVNRGRGRREIWFMESARQNKETDSKIK